MEKKILTEVKRSLSLSNDLVLIGEGGQKSVYKSRNDVYGEIVIKIIELHSENILKRALRELEITTKLGGEEFPKVFKYDYINIKENRYLFVLEEYIYGTTLRKYMNEKKVTLDEAINIGKTLLRSLIRVHNKKLVHRDLKPENIILNPER